jgi:hypothetical protein
VGQLRIVNGDPGRLVEVLKQQEGGDMIVLASSSVIKALLRAAPLTA